MNSDNLIQVLQKGFRVTLGATASLVETLQDPQKREQNLSELRSGLTQRVQEWAQKGEITEQEARNIVDTILRQRTYTPNAPSTTPTEPVTRTSTATAPPDVQLEMQELTAQIAAMRAELEKLRDSNPEA